MGFFDILKRKKNYAFLSRLEGDGVYVSLVEGEKNKTPLADNLTLPEEKKLSDDHGKTHIIYNIKQLAKTIEGVLTDNIVREQLLEFFDEEELVEPLVGFKEGDIYFSFPVYFSLIHGDLADEAGLSEDDILALNLLEYENLRVRIRTVGNFRSPEYRFEFDVIDESGGYIDVAKVQNSVLYGFVEKKYLLRPLFKKLIARLLEHQEKYKSGILNDDINLRYKEFSDIKILADAASTQLAYTLDEDLVYLDEIPVFVGRDIYDENVIVPKLPMEYTFFDSELQRNYSSWTEDKEFEAINLKKNGRRLRVVLSDKAKSTFKKVKTIQNLPPEEVDKICKNPDAHFSQESLTVKLGEGFSSRVTGIILGKVSAESDVSDRDNQWNRGLEEQTLLIRSIDNEVFPVELAPVPENYEIIRRKVNEVAERLDDEEIKLRLERGLVFTQLPDRQDEEIYIEEFGTSFRFSQLASFCARVESENIPDINEENIEKAEELFVDAKETDKQTMLWTEEEADVVIPVESIRRAIERIKKTGKDQKEAQKSVSLDVEDINVKRDFAEGGRNYQLIDPVGLREEIELKRHQKVGYSWLRWIIETDFGDSKGALLADDMGLGKTLQVIAAINYVKSKDDWKHLPVLVVAPVSLINGSWITQGFKKFVKPEFISTDVLDGPEFVIRNYKDCPCYYPRQKLIEEAINILGQMEKEEKSFKDCLISDDLRTYLDNIKEWFGSSIIFTSYETMRQRSLELGWIDFSLVVLDEAQKIKNRGTAQSKSSKAIKSRVSIAMTGTPIENSLMDLWSIMDFSAPGKLGSRESFKSDFMRRVKESDYGSQDRIELQNELEQRLSPFWLRRVKHEVLKEGDALPGIIHYDSLIDNDKTYNAHAVAISEVQKIIYLENVGLFNTASNRQRLPALQRMLEACSSPWTSSVIDVGWDQSTELFELCPKLKATFDILEEIYNRTEEEGRKVIIFADKKRTQRDLAFLIHDWVLKTKNKKVEVEVYNGDVRPSAREDMLNRFEASEGFHVLVISPKAGGAGLNIEFANNVIHYNRGWNPALERQATDRVYRIGQKRKVHVYYPTTTGNGEFETAEERLGNLLASKREIMDDFTISPKSIVIGADDFIDLQGGHKVEDINISINNVDTRSPDEFEAYIACVFEKMGYKTWKVGRSGDCGADVVCIGETNNLLIQCKQTIGYHIGRGCIREIRAAKSTYENCWKRDFDLVAVTNNIFDDHVFEFARNGDVVELWDKHKIMGRGREFHTVTLLEIQKKLREEPPRRVL